MIAVVGAGLVVGSAAPAAAVAECGATEADWKGTFASAGSSQIENPATLTFKGDGTLSTEDPGQPEGEGTYKIGDSGTTVDYAYETEDRNHNPINVEVTYLIRSLSCVDGGSVVTAFTAITADGKAVVTYAKKQ
ncbi:hypothetical protein [Nocardia sp. CS682]|uniref:hypothetical protein n=1 Tax=Nocardia sp. CS682 TaxID=1047172 RepID=UPI00107580E1|nr:hypothetical protein [Nocardia sp. CS682]QBS43476.1 hypothetical protein DMB37_28585 [Nocardia sp. CS682]